MDRAKLDASHDWHVQPVVKDPFGLSAWAVPVWIEAPTRCQGVLELAAPADELRFRAHTSLLCANLLILSNLGHLVKPNFSVHAAQSLKEPPVKSEQHSPEPTRLTRALPPGPAMVCSLWDSRQGSRVNLLPDPANQLPTSLNGQAQGHREAPLLIHNFQRVAHATHPRNWQPALPFLLICDLLRISTTHLESKAGLPVDGCGKVEKQRIEIRDQHRTSRAIRDVGSWKDRSPKWAPAETTASLRPSPSLSPSYPCRGMMPRSVRPFTKYCIARATSSNPMMRTRIRMPVSPRTPRTRPALARTQ